MQNIKGMTLTEFERLSPKDYGYSRHMRMTSANLHEDANVGMGLYYAKYELESVPSGDEPARTTTIAVSVSWEGDPANGQWAICSNIVDDWSLMQSIGFD